MPLQHHVQREHRQAGRPAVAIRADQSTPSEEKKPCRPSWITEVCPRSTIAGQKNSFQAVMNSRMASALSAAPRLGTTTVHSVAHDDRPSISAASSSSRGKLRRCWRSMSTAIAELRFGTITPASVLISPNWTSRRSSTPS